MMMNSIRWLELALALGPVLIGLAAYELVFVRPLRRRVRESAERHSMLQRSLRETTRLVVRIANSDRTVRDELSRLGERLGQLELRSEVRPYQQAISLAEKGEQAERLVSCFGLTEGEASLVSLLHGDRRAPPRGR